MSQDSLKTPKVVVGMSGGVDSSVAALLLKQQGYDVRGLFMKNWEEKDENGVCSSARDFEDVSRVCDQIGIPYHAIEFVQEYWDHVIKEFVEDFKRGFTPNPDVLCNREIKFNVFFKKAMELGADFLATGHYCQNLFVDGRPHLARAADANKDQTYFLYTLNDTTLGKVVFPIGGLQKSEVRRLAQEHGLSTHAKKDSTGICFIGERDFREFLSRYIDEQVGEFRHLDGTVVGRHRGFPFYTIGQRRGLGLGGEGESWFVVAKDPKLNIVYVERGDLHPALYADDLLANEVSWVKGSAPSNFPFHCRAKIRYRQTDQECLVEQSGDGQLMVRFARPQRAITPRQSIVFYQNEICLGGAMIESAGPTYQNQGKSMVSSLTRHTSVGKDHVPAQCSV